MLLEQASGRSGPARPEAARHSTTVSADTQDRGVVSTKHITALDGWRGVAILMVLCSHGFRLEHFLPFDLGNSGVVFFMILSGYLITTRLLTTYRSPHGIAFARFYVRRAFRILPPVFLYLAVLVSLNFVAHSIRTSRIEILASLFFWRNYVLLPHTGKLTGWFTGHFWSLAVEEHFYLMWPLIMHFGGRKRTFRIALTGAAACAFWRWFGLAYGIREGYLLDHVLYYFRTDTRIDTLLIGCAIALALSRTGWESIARRYLPVEASAILLGFLGVMLVLTGQWFSGLKEELIVAALLVITLVHPGNGMARLLSWRPLRAVGILSYSLYIWQQLLLTPEDAGWWTRFPANLLLVFAAAAGSYYLIERPAVALGVRLTRSRAASAES